MTAESKSPGKACLGGILGIMISLTYSGCFSVEEPVSVQDGAGRDWQSEVEKELVISGLREGDPWSLAHLHLALPEESELQNSRDQLHQLLSDIDSVIPIHGDHGERGEQHPHLLLRTGVLLQGPEISEALRNRTQQELSKTSYVKEWRAVNDYAWLLDAAARCGLKRQVLVLDGTLGDLVDESIRTLEQGDAVISPILAKSPTLETRRPAGLSDPAVAGCWAFTCGGTHLLGALVECALSGLILPEDRKRIDALLSKFEKRLRWDLSYRHLERDRAIRAGKSSRKADRNFGLAQIKVLGHGLEVLSRARRLYSEDSQVFSSSMNQMLQELENLFLPGRYPGFDPVALLEQKVSIENPETWERAHGDLSHLIRGLRLAKDSSKY